MTFIVYCDKSIKMRQRDKTFRKARRTGDLVDWDNARILRNSLSMDVGILALGDAEVLFLALGDAKVPDARYLAFWWNIGLSV